ncbi:MAG TPA: hypothetical protein VIW29_12400 [Polyangiaceae bacterium]
MRSLLTVVWFTTLTAAWVACGSSDGVRNEPPDSDGGESGSGGEGAAVGGEARGGDFGGGGTVNGDAGAMATPSDGGGGGDPSDGSGGTAAGGAAGTGAAGDTSTAGAGGTGPASELAVVTHFNVGQQLCGLGFDSNAQALWAQPCFGASMLSYSTAGTAGPTALAPGELADDVDVDFTPTALTLGQQQLPAHSALFFNGETGALDIHAVDLMGTTSSPIATLTTAFGDSHVVGGSFHVQRGTFFAVQDRVPGAALGNVVAEIDPASGAVLNDFSLLPGFDVNYGDLDVCQSTGHLLAVSSVENVVAVLEPSGAILAKYPAEVAGLSAIAVDDTTGDAWVAAPAGDIWQLRGLPCAPFVP